jgi:hypothetical protein
LDFLDTLDQPAIYQGFLRSMRQCCAWTAWTRLKGTAMSKLTKEQIEFSNAMTIKQRSVLRALSMWPWYMSASERADGELYELIRNKLVRCHCDAAGLPSWGVTEAGKRVAATLETSEAAAALPERTGVLSWPPPRCG